VRRILPQLIGAFPVRASDHDSGVRVFGGIGARAATEERLSFDRALSDGDIAERASARTKSGASRQSGGGGSATDGALDGDDAPSCGASSAM
jgi:hypothetical protein